MLRNLSFSVSLKMFCTSVTKTWSLFICLRHKISSVQLRGADSNNIVMRKTDKRQLKDWLWGCYKLIILATSARKKTKFVKQNHVKHHSHSHCRTDLKVDSRTSHWTGPSSNTTCNCLVGKYNLIISYSIWEFKHRFSSLNEQRWFKRNTRWFIDDFVSEKCSFVPYLYPSACSNTLLFYVPLDVWIVDRKEQTFLLVVFYLVFVNWFFLISVSYQSPWAKDKVS